jgi:two-component system CheB/CheR fusion protein
MISAYLGLLERRLGAGLDGETRTFLGFALDGARRLDRMIVDLLRYSRIGRDTAPFAPVDLGLAIKDSLRHLDVAIGEAGALVTVAADLPVIPAERGEMVRLFQNLIGNTVTYAQPGRPPRVRVEWQEAEAEWVISVYDNGIGIAPNDLTRIFGIFQRLVTRDTVDGTGIGLAICRKIAEHHGGRIWVESQPEIGSVFRVALPKRHDPQDGADNPAALH